MPTRTSHGLEPLGGAFLRFVSMAAVLALLGSCVSTPCVGDACPDACSGIACDQATAAPVDPTTPGRFTPCASNAGCDQVNGFECVDGSCRHPCRSHFDCGGVGVCEPSGRDGSFCALTDPPTKPGGYYSRCPDGRCDPSGEFTCVGAGIGDAEAYCTKTCVGDTDCPTGFLCDTVTGENGTESVCVPRGFCAECESSTDCLSIPGGVCARDASGEHHCTQLCNPIRNSCPWGTATECLVTDDELGVPTCQHRFGACRGEGNGCDPCLRDVDCPGGLCFDSFYTGERWCIDRESPCTCEGLPSIQDFCAGANGCGNSPGGLSMVCVDQGAAGGGVCVGVNLPGASSTQLSCWR